MGEYFMGEIRAFSFSFPPKGWAWCYGQLLAINQNQALFSLLGTTYGGNGVNNFALPDLRGRAAVHPDASVSLPQGTVGGAAQHTLKLTEMPSHTHQVRAGGAATTPNPTGAVWAGGSSPTYGGSADVDMAASAMSAAGGSQPHENMPPHLVINYAIALQGIFPGRN